MKQKEVFLKKAIPKAGKNWGVVGRGCAMVSGPDRVVCWHLAHSVPGTGAEKMGFG